MILSYLHVLRYDFLLVMQKGVSFQVTPCAKWPPSASRVNGCPFSIVNEHAKTRLSLVKVITFFDYFQTEVK